MDRRYRGDYSLTAKCGHKHEWKRVEPMTKEGQLTYESLREKLNKGEFLFEEYIEKALLPSN